MKIFVLISVFLFATMNLFSQTIVVSESELKVNGFRMKPDMTPYSVESLFGVPDDKEYGFFGGDLNYTYNKYGVEFSFSEAKGGIYLISVKASMKTPLGNGENDYKGYVDILGNKIFQSTTYDEIKSIKNIDFEYTDRMSFFGCSSNYCFDIALLSGRIVQYILIVL